MTVPAIRTPMPIGPCVSLTVDPIDPAFVVLEWRYAENVHAETLHADDLRTALAAVATPGRQEDREELARKIVERLFPFLRINATAGQVSDAARAAADDILAARQPAVQTVSAERFNAAAEVVWAMYGEDDPAYSAMARAVTRDVFAAAEIEVHDV